MPELPEEFEHIGLTAHKLRRLLECEPSFFGQVSRGMFPSPSDWARRQIVLQRLYTTLLCGRSSTPVDYGSIRTRNFYRLSHRRASGDRLMSTAELPIPRIYCPRSSPGAARPRGC